MKFSLGDRVLMKRTGEEGIITAFLSKQIIEVEVGDIKFPVYADEIDHPYLKWFTDPKAPRLRKAEKIVPVEKAAAKPVRLSQGIYLSFMPEFAADNTEDIIESFRIHFLNETAEHLSFTYHARRADGDTLLQLNGTLHPFGNIFLHRLTLEEVNAQPRFNWSVAPKDKPANSIADILRIRPAQLIKYISVLYSGEPSFSVLLSGDAEAIPMPAAHLPQAELVLHAAPQPALQLYTKAVSVLDLHLNAPGESPEQILSMQISLLEQNINAAYAAGMESMVVIHGIGAGTLRGAVHKVLGETPFVQRFVNEWTGAYGWGATEIFFK